MKQTIKRNKEIKIRLTEEEHQALLERMTGGELATWMRSVCLDEKPNKKRNYKVADPILLNALARIGGNLNQIARHRRLVCCENLSPRKRDQVERPETPLIPSVVSLQQSNDDKLQDQDTRLLS